MNRRRFLALSTGAIGLGLLEGLARPQDRAPVQPPSTAAGDNPAQALPDLVVTRGDPQAAVRRALDALGGIGRFVKPGSVVVVKPNASFATSPEIGATTHPLVLAGVLGLCQEAGARRVFVVDHTLAPAERCFARTGIADAVSGFPNAKLVSLDDARGYRAIEVPAGQALHKTDIPEVVLRADVLINVPSAKAHSATEVSLGLKNLMGLVWDRQVFHNDMDIHVGIADLATVLRPQLTIVDAMFILKTGGPEGPGDVDPYNGIVAGTDPVAVDACALGLSTWNRQTIKPEHLGYLRQAAARGIGTLDLASLKVVELL